ncbi:alpha/beta hydrolase [Nocardioides sp. GY 10113]|uniref:alpha/beta fold hydrolase n=1 Tax=Nocardioides sp. GY 10113 TaxID=2569761 RepID=UPI0010A7B3F6|nr:alpha/beta fold hydrolase [Nocardioides sp. GY 10113]TIC85953.1 alpha/beta hydrolase [Nocardioides sp. GY 10113]
MEQLAEQHAGRHTVGLPQVSLSSLVWGPIDERDRPLAVLLHGFPDTAHTWRHLGPALAAAGYRVVAPFTRGYAPSGLPADGVHHVAALMADAIDLHAAYGGDDRAVLVGHDWGAITGNGVAALPGSPYGRVVSLAVPPIATLSAAPRDALGVIPRQASKSWYTLFNQLPAVPERYAETLVRHLWRRWSPGYDATEDLEHLWRSIPAGPHRSAAFDYYRDTFRRRRFPDAYRACADAWLDPPTVPLLYLHGTDDGCFDAGWVPKVEAALGQEGSGGRVAVIADAGHFLHLERPGAVNARILEFLALEGVEGVEGEAP